MRKKPNARDRRSRYPTARAKYRRAQRQRLYLQHLASKVSAKLEEWSDNAMLGCFETVSSGAAQTDEPFTIEKMNEVVEKLGPPPAWNALRMSPWVCSLVKQLADDSNLYFAAPFVSAAFGLELIEDPALPNCVFEYVKRTGGNIRVVKVGVLEDFADDDFDVHSVIADIARRRAEQMKLDLELQQIREEGDSV